MNNKCLTSLSTGHFLLRAVLRWLRHFTAKLRYTKNARYKGVMCQRNVDLKRWISYLSVGVVCFIAGSLWGKLNFIQSDVRLLEKEVKLQARGDSIGIIPAGSELHYHSSAHGTTKYFVFIELPEKEVLEKVSKTQIDNSAGIKPLLSNFGNGT